ncbi:MAG: hypothetical protein AB7S41_00780 [Parvibaculaceae bacterium]
MKLRLSDQSRVYRHLYCADFIRTGESPEVVELQLEEGLDIDPISGEFGAMEVTVDCLHWDDVSIHHDLLSLGDEQVAPWFDLWFDPDEIRLDAAAEHSSCIHALTVEPGVLTVDLGTAPEQAFWDLLALLERKGVGTARVTCQRGG